jgi:hypothetical protein
MMDEINALALGAKDPGKKRNWFLLTECSIL